MRCLLLRLNTGGDTETEVQVTNLGTTLHCAKPFCMAQPGTSLEEATYIAKHSRAQPCIAAWSSVKNELLRHY
eukprot:s1485_g1.t5